MDGSEGGVIFFSYFKPEGGCGFVNIWKKTKGLFWNCKYYFCLTDHTFGKKQLWGSSGHFFVFVFPCSVMKTTVGMSQ